MMQKSLILGQTLEFLTDPFAVPVEDATRHRRHGAVLIADGVIAAVGEADALRAAHPEADVTDMGQALLSPGFVDAHVHYPQTAMIASWGKRLIDWLNTYTFPEEMRFGDVGYAEEIAGRYMDLALAHGTTSVASFCTIHPESVDAFFGAAAARNMAVTGGKTCMDRNAPDGLCDTAQSAYDDSARLLDKWHDTGRAQYAITPRFSPTSTPEQLEALGALWAENPSCPMQTHLSEQVDEIEWVRNLFPNARDYLDTYEQFGLVGPGAIFGHSIHLEEREIARIHDAGASVVHCPTSNTFIGSGLCDVHGLKTRGVPCGLATDTGGGSSFSMLRTMAAAYEVAQLRGVALHAAQLMYLATEGSAKAIGRGDEIGALRVGAAADLVALDLNSTPAIAQRSVRAGDVWEALFPTIMMGDDRAISQVWISGQALT